jgi:hypothetical protein
MKLPPHSVRRFLFVKLFFLDESGDHSLEVIDKDYPVFVLGGIIVDRAYYRAEVEPRVRKLKEDFLGDAEVILHTTDIIRARNGFEPLGDPETRAGFYEELNTLMRDLDYKVVACAIKKDAHLAQYKDHAVDPYSYALEVVVERFCHEVGDVEDGGLIFAERRRPDLDDALEAQWRKLREHGSDYASKGDIDKRIVDLSLKSKKPNTAGLQLADLVVSPIGRHVIGKKPQPDWEIVESKFRRGWNGYKGYGLVTLPREAKK